MAVKGTKVARHKEKMLSIDICESITMGFDVKVGKAYEMMNILKVGGFVKEMLYDNKKSVWMCRC
jgi:hypothetical protein